MNSSNESFPSMFLSICRNIFSVLFSGVASSSGIFITDPTWKISEYSDHTQGWHNYLDSPSFCKVQYKGMCDDLLLVLMCTQAGLDSASSIINPAEHILRIR